MCLRFEYLCVMRVSCALAAAALLGARPAHAQSQRAASVRLVVERTSSAAQCADEEQTRARVTARLGYDPFRSDAPALARLRWNRRAGRFVLNLELDRPGLRRPARRSLSSRARTCETISDTMSLALAIAIDPVAAARIASSANGNTANSGAPDPTNTVGRTTSGSSAPTAPTAPPSTQPEELLPVTRSSAAPLISWVARLGALPSSALTRWFVAARIEATLPALVPTADLGSVSVGGQAALGVGVARAWWSLRLDAWLSLPARLARSTPFDLWNIGFTATSCGHPLASIALCAATATSITGASSADANVQLVAAAVAPGWALGGRVAWEPRLGRSRVSLLVALEALAWVATPALRLDTQAQWSRQRLTATLSAGVAVDL